MVFRSLILSLVINITIILLIILYYYLFFLLSIYKSDFYKSYKDTSFIL